MAQSAREYCLGAEEIVKKVESERRAMTKAEKESVNDYLERVEDIDANEAIRDFKWYGTPVPEKHREAYRRTVEDEAEREVIRGKIDRVLNAGAAGRGSFSRTLLQNFSKSNPFGFAPLSAALGVKAPTIPSAETWDVASGAVTAIGYDKRWMYRSIPTRQVDEGETAVSDFRVTARGVTGSVTRAIDSVSAKATLDHTFEAVVSELEQHAILIPDIPNALIEIRNGALRQILDGEGRQQVGQSIDAATYAAIVASAASGGAGADLLTKIRTGIGDLRDEGYEPDLLVVSGTDSAALDLFDNDGFIFPLRDSGQSSPLFGLKIVESKAAAGDAPLLVDTRRIGQLWLGSISFAADTFSSFDKNLTTLRFETSAKMVVRDTAAAIVLDES
jgi:hypothetical protein